MLRRASFEDLQRIKEIEDICFLGKDPWPIPAFTDSLKDEKSLFLVSIDIETGIISGYILSCLIPPFEAQILSIAVDPKYQGKGISKELLQETISYCEELSIFDITLEVRTSNIKAIGLYQGFGFLKEGLRKGYYTDNEDAILMWRRR